MSLTVGITILILVAALIVLTFALFSAWNKIDFLNKSLANQRAIAKNNAMLMESCIRAREALSQKLEKMEKYKW